MDCLTVHSLCTIFLNGLQYTWYVLVRYLYPEFTELTERYPHLLVQPQPNYLERYNYNYLAGSLMLKYIEYAPYYTLKMNVFITKVGIS